MDENYLDELLTGMSSNNKPNKNFDNAVDKDAGIDIDMSDLDDISLDELDELDDLDLGDLDIDDIDFDDIDITSLSAPKKNEAPKKEEDFSLDDLLMEAMEEITGGKGFDVCVEACGLSNTFLNCIDAVAFAGNIILIGNGKKETTFLHSVLLKKEVNMFLK